LKAKRTAKSKSPTRRAKKKKATAKKKIIRKALKPAPIPDVADPAALSAFAALNDEFSLANAWDILGDEEYLLDEEVWNTVYNRIKLQLLQTTYSFRVETDGATLSPYAVIPMPAFRSENEPGFLSAGSFTILRPELPGIVFDLKISTSDAALLLDWQLTRKDSKPNLGHIALYLDGDLVEAVNLVQNRCLLELTREDIGDAAFYFLDSETGKQVKILELGL
jgi:hypothetical protein